MIKTIKLEKKDEWYQLQLIKENPCIKVIGVYFEPNLDRKEQGSFDIEYRKIKEAENISETLSMLHEGAENSIIINQELDLSNANKIEVRYVGDNSKVKEVGVYIKYETI